MCTTLVHKTEKKSKCVQAFQHASLSKSVKGYSCAAPTGLCHSQELLLLLLIFRPYGAASSELKTGKLIHIEMENEAMALV
jgi:hypothetical protein